MKRTIEMPAGMLFHLGNGWDEGGTVRLDACIAADDTSLRALGSMMRGTEFPRVAAADIGGRYRQLFVTTSGPTDQFGATGVARIDVETGHTDRVEFCEHWIVEEHIPVRKASGRGRWLVGVAYDLRRQQTVLAAFDGDHLAHGSVARARLPYAAPLCSHGNFLAA